MEAASIAGRGGSRTFAAELVARGGGQRNLPQEFVQVLLLWPAERREAFELCDLVERPVAGVAEKARRLQSGPAPA